jgi:ferredoxin
MEKAISYAKSKGKGIYAMKIFGGGNLSKDTEECFKYALNLRDLDSMAIGMITRDEIDYNINKILGLKIDESLSSKVKNRNKKLLVEFWCTGCGTCVEKCHQNAMEIIHGKAEVNSEKCLVCGYCGAYCPQFCIKVV